MTAPTPVTSTSIVLLSSSRTRPSGTNRTGRRAIQVNSIDSRCGVANTTQLPAKQASTAATEMKLLVPGDLLVTSAMVTAATNGNIRIYQGSALITLVARESREFARMDQKGMSSRSKTSGY